MDMDDLPPKTPPHQSVLPNNSMRVRGQNVGFVPHSLLESKVAELRLLQMPKLRRNARRWIARQRSQIAQSEPRTALVRAQHYVSQHFPLCPRASTHSILF